MTIGWLNEEACRTRASLKWSRFRDKVIPLDVGEIDCHLYGGVVKAIESCASRSDLGYSPVTNLLLFPTSLAADYRRQGISVEPSHIQAVGGTIFGVSECIRSACEIGDSVAVLGPAYPGLVEAVQYVGRSPIVVDMLHGEKGYTIDRSAIEDLLGRGCRTLLTSQPHVPTGSILSTGDAQFLRHLAENGVCVIVDAVYRFLSPRICADVMRELWNPRARVMWVGSITKCWAVPSVRGAWIAFANEEDLGCYRVSSIPRMCPPTALFASVAECCITEGQEWVLALWQAIEQNRMLAIELLKSAAPAEALDASGSGPYLWINLKALGVRSDSPSLHLLRKARVAIDDGIQYGSKWKAFGRIYLGAHPEVLERALERVLNVIV